ncbi:TadE/TadG family type IV pilus assembly protein [Rhodovulum strictum]|uniref:Pilus assembly protein n=1 Tax=Rhodovulum strictum TaxID=58314 RepID=A0A844BID1_9RHOB|nr:TadE family protein [Rhodovulum strictum]MRH20812.1 pilus assembly protein [Rhodovulum strictum]
MRTRPRLLPRIAPALRREDGTATVEVVLALPIVMLVFLMGLEASILMTRQMLLEHALDVSMRDIRLGKHPGLDHDKFKDIVCSQANLFPDCRNVVRIELSPISKTTWTLPGQAATCVDRRAEMQPVTNFTQGPQNSLMMVRACVVVDPFFPGIGLGLRLHTTSGDGYALVATSAFVNEPGAGT